MLPLSDGRLRISGTWNEDPEKVEMIEEWRPAPNGKFDLQLRKWRRTDRMTGASPWALEIGGKEIAPSKPLLVSESSTNPTWCQRDSTTAFVFEVGNIPYPIETYAVTVDVEKNELVLRTSNKKFFRRWMIGQLRRRSIALDEKLLSLSHDGTSTLTILVKLFLVSIEG